MKSLYVPAELVDAYRASGTDRAVWKDVALLSSILSPADVAFYIHANIESHNQYEGALVKDFSNLMVELFSAEKPIGFIFEMRIADGDPTARKVARALNDLSNGTSKSQYKVPTEVPPTVLYTDDELLVYTIGGGQENSPTDGWYEFIANLRPYYQRFEDLATLNVFTAYLKHRPQVLGI